MSNLRPEDLKTYASFSRSVLAEATTPSSASRAKYFGHLETTAGKPLTHQTSLFFEDHALSNDVSV